MVVNSLAHSIIKSSAEMIWIVQNKTIFVLQRIYLNHMRHFNKQISEKVQIYLLLLQNNSARGWLMYLLRITPRVDGVLSWMESAGKITTSLVEGAENPVPLQ